MRTNDPIVVSSGDTEARISPLGCELRSCRVGSRELIWPGDPASWPRSAPVLFPFCGWLNGGVFRVDGQAYPTNVHGFGPTTAYEVIEAGDGRAVLEMRDSRETRGKFPFAFVVTVRVTVVPGGVDYAFAVANPGDVALPYSLGFHPGFICPLDGASRADHRIVFERDEIPAFAETLPGGLFTGASVTAPNRDRVLDFVAAQKDRDSLILLNARSKKVSLRSPSGTAIDVEVDAFPHWVFWSRPGADYLCIEGWTGHGDPAGFAGDVRDKPGMTLLPPGEERRYGYRFRLRGPG